VVTKKIKEPQARAWLIFRLVTGAALLSILAWWLFLSGFFNIREILIEGEAGDEIIREVNSLKGRNIFLLGGKRAEESLKQKQPGIKEIRIVRGLPSTIKIELVERDSSLTWQTGDKMYLVDSQGVAFRQVERVKHLLIKDTDNIEVQLGKVILDEDFIRFVELANQEIPLRTEFKIEYFEIKESTYQLYVKTEQERTIILNTMRQLTPQITALKKIYAKHKDEIEEYIDLRVEGMVYYK
jgi:cell division septal protein FtsQ